MSKLGIVGAILFALAVAVGYFFSFDGAIIVELALGAFGLAALVVNAIKEGKAKELPLWKILTPIALALIAGTLCFIGGATDSLFAQISAAVLALITIIVGAVAAKV